jgi:riboflavin kinase/FMN adenylyltransferase
VELAGERISSTAIRGAILAGDFARAAELLGRPFSLYGTVVHGDGRGRSLGYPTANIDPHNETMPPDGVYAAWGIAGDEVAPAVVSVGRRETFRDLTDGTRTVEIHLLERAGDLYGRNMEAQIVGLLREQRAFARPEELVAQMARDVEEARTVLAGAGPPPTA